MNLLIVFVKTCKIISKKNKICQHNKAVDV